MLDSSFLDIRGPIFSQVRSRSEKFRQITSRYGIILVADSASNPPDVCLGYSVVTYLLQIKDRHNGNILLDRDGHLIHIDFGFMLSNSPGNIGFEAAPFKLPPEYVEILGGVTGAPFLEFRRLFREGFEAARKHCDELISTNFSSPVFGVSLLRRIFHSSRRIDAERQAYLYIGLEQDNTNRYQPQIRHCHVLPPLGNRLLYNFGNVSNQHSHIPSLLNTSNV